ncbi:hypothetical protein ACWGN5_25525 [Streptomyces sp. NPDC055815]
MASEILTRPDLGVVTVGVDGSPSARTAALWADAETIQAVREAARDLPADTAAAGHEGFPDLVGHHVETGTSIPGLLIEASGRTDLLVRGRGRRTLGVGPSPGRVAHARVHHSRCPVEVIPSVFVAEVGRS